MPSVFAPLLYVVVFIVVASIFQVLAGMFFVAGDRSRRVNRRLTMLDSGLTREQVYSALVRKTAVPNVGGVHLLDLYTKIDIYRRQAGLSISPLRLVAITAGIAVLLWFVALGLVRAGGGSSLLLNAVASLVGACGLAILGVGWWVRGKRNKRLKLIEEQLPLALDIINRAIRAGHPVIAAVQLAASEMGDPVGSEFGLIVDETTYGAELKEALVNFARRTGSQDAHYFAVAVGVQSETGGNLAEILNGLATLIRGRNTLGKRVKALASEGKASAYLLSALPPGMVGFQLLINPKYYTDKFSDPVFWPWVAGIVALYFLGWIMIHRIINFKY
jgi:tight adherence protein B